MQEIQRLGVAKRWCTAASFNGISFLGGHVAKETRGQSLAAQTTEVLALLEQHLVEVGSSKDRILGAQIFISDITQAPVMNEIWDRWVAPGHPAARACVQVVLPTGIDVEITATAAQIPR